jgi:hypothetical protein
MSYIITHESVSFIHSVFCLTTGPTPLPKRFLHIVRSRASSFKWEYPFLSLRSSNSFLRLLPRLLVTSYGFLNTKVLGGKHLNVVLFRPVGRIWRSQRRFTWSPQTLNTVMFSSVMLNLTEIRQYMWEIRGEIQADVNTVTNFRVPYNAGNIWTCWITINLSENNLLRGDN